MEREVGKAQRIKELMEKDQQLEKFGFEVVGEFRLEQVV